MSMRSALVAVLSLGAISMAGCATFHEDLERGKNAYEANSHERALAVLRNLEPDLSHLSSQERAEYSYLRGMTDFRIGYKADARHWLALAKAMEDESPGTLPGDWKPRMEEALTSLNDQVYAGGIASLSNMQERAGDTPAATAAPVTSAPPAPAAAPAKAKSEDEP
jgi:hypothetical protein